MLILVQLNKCVVCGTVFQRGYSSDGCFICIDLFRYEHRMGHVFVLGSVGVGGASSCKF